MPRILSIGQCAADNYGLSAFFRSNFDTEIQPAATAKEAFEILGKGTFDLVLVNRLLDYDGSPGIDIIRRLKGDAERKAMPVMLVSNLANAQIDAQAAGALPGFGKAQLNEPQTLERLNAVLK